MSLTELLCANAKTKNTAYKIYDEDGLYLHVMPTGKKYWRYKYNLHGEKTIALGRYPEVSLLDARNKRYEESRNVSNGLDPLHLKEQEKLISAYKASQTFELIAREWHNRNYSSWAERHANCILYRMENYLFRHIGSLPITTITPQILLSALQKIENTSPDIARRIVQYIRRICAYATVTGRLDRDLTFGLSDVMKKPKRGHVASIEVEELPALLKAINSDKEVSYKQTNLAVRMLLLTLVRTRELIEAKWDEINFEKALWIIPAERMKMRKQHLVPLSKQVISILRELQELTGHREYIFASIPRPKNPISNNTILFALYRMGYKDKMTGHGFRALGMGVIKEQLHYRHEVVDRQLSHAPKSEVDKAYDRAKFLAERTKMMQEFADYIDNISKPKQTERQSVDGTNYNLKSYATNYSSYEYNRSIESIEQYKPIKSKQGSEIRKISETTQEWTSKCLDNEGNTSVH